VTNLAAEALSRTALFLRLDAFGGDADEAAIVEGLTATTVRIASDGRNLASPAGQTAVSTLYGQLAMLGLRVTLHIPDVPLVMPQPPLRGNHLGSALEDYGSDLIPRSRGGAESSPALTFVIGDTPWPGGGPAIRVEGDGWAFRLGDAEVGHGMPWKDDRPFGALAAGAAGAAEGLRPALPLIAKAVGSPLPPAHWWHLDHRRSVAIDLGVPGLDVADANLRTVDIISGGAITTSAMYVLLRLPRISGLLRLIEPEILDLSNLNRYSLARRSDLGRAKAEFLAGFSSERFVIEPLVRRFDAELAAEMGGLGLFVCVGVDNIPSRWVVQAAAPGWVCVGATSHDFVMVTTHIPGGPCAGCAHPRDEEGDGPIPTISFVSFWAGLLQARSLLARTAGLSSPPSVYAWPLGLFGQQALLSLDLAPNPACPVRCHASVRVDVTL